MLTSPSAETEQKSRVPVIREELIEFRAEMLLESSLPGSSKRATSIPVDMIAEQDLGLKIDYQYLTSDGSLRSVMVYDEGTVNIYEGGDLTRKRLLIVERGDMVVDRSLTAATKEQDYKRRFAIAHEIGHWLLHQEMHRALKMEYRAMNSTEKNHLEWQADYFASCLLMPRVAINRLFEEWLHRNKLSRSYLISLHKQKDPHSDTILQSLVSTISVCFEVPKRNAETRMHQIQPVNKFQIH